MVVKYERIQRLGTPSVLSVDFSPAAIHDQKIQVWVNNSLVKPLGNQRVVPQPLQSVVGAGGILYTFQASTSPASIEFETQPTAVGLTKLVLQVSQHATTELSIFVMP